MECFHFSCMKWKPNLVLFAIRRNMLQILLKSRNQKVLPKRTNLFFVQVHEDLGRYTNKLKKDEYQRLVLPHPQSVTFAIVSRYFEKIKSIIVMNQKCHHLFIKKNGPQIQFWPHCNWDVSATRCPN